MQCYAIHQAKLFTWCVEQKLQQLIFLDFNLTLLRIINLASTVYNSDQWSYDLNNAISQKVDKW